jgi:hypothetical protein
LVWLSFFWRQYIWFELSAFNDIFYYCLLFLQASVGLDDMKAS